MVMKEKILMTQAVTHPLPQQILADCDVSLAGHSCAAPRHHGQEAETALVSLSEVIDFIALLKPRVMMLVIFTGAVGMYLAPTALHPLQCFIALLCLSVAAGASGALNMWLEIPVDRLMHRTRDRPLVRGVIAPSDAATMGCIMSLLSVMIMGLGVNWVAAGWLAFSIFFYVVVYTILLKPWTVQNIVIGGIAGALPPIIGWAAMTGETGLHAWSLFLLIFLWTPPHFWTLSIWCAADYKRAGIPMLPNVAGVDETRRQIGVYGGLVVLGSVLPLAIDEAVGHVYLAAIIVLNIVWMRACLTVYLRGTLPDQKRLFWISIVYLFSAFLMRVIDSLWMKYHLGS